MPRGGAHLSAEEIAQVLSRFDIGIIHQVRHLNAGNRSAPKVVIVSEQGKFLLKRRPKGKDDFYRVAFAHALQAHLAGKGFPVTTLMATKKDKSTVLQLDHHIYELFKFITGIRYNGTAEATFDAGSQLAEFHKNVKDFQGQWQPLKATYHDCSGVRRNLKAFGFDKKNGRDRDFQKTAEELMRLYNASTVKVNELGFDSWDQQIVHGDWHPGNMLFDNSRLIAVLDFDSVKLAPAVTDLANGMLQFSIIGDRPNPADWPDHFDEPKLLQFLNGYRSQIQIEPVSLDSIVDLMIETMIAEAVLPVAATGFFGHASGPEFLKMILRKSNWLEKNKKKLTKAILPPSS